MLVTVKSRLIKNITCFFTMLENCVKAVFSHSRGLNGLLGIFARCPLCQGVHRHTFTSWGHFSFLQPGLCSQGEGGLTMDWLCRLYRKPRRSPGLWQSKYLSTKYLSTNQPKPTFKRCFPHGIPHPEGTMTYMITAIKNSHHNTNS